MSEVSVIRVEITKLQYSKWIIITNCMGFEDICEHSNNKRNLLQIYV
jgi:hypothetical protein